MSATIIQFPSPKRQPVEPRLADDELAEALERAPGIIAEFSSQIGQGSTRIDAACSRGCAVCYRECAVRRIIADWWQRELAVAFAQIGRR